MGICRGISSVCVYNALLLVLYGKESSADGLSDIVKGLVNDHGQLDYLGRTIHYSSHGRVHSWDEPWVYDATAWDVESGTSVKEHHFDEAEEATRKAIETLILELKQKGILTDEPLNDGAKPTPKLPDILETPDDRPDDHQHEIPEGDGSRHPGGNLDSSGDESRQDGAKPTPKPPDILETPDDRPDTLTNKIPEGDGSKHPGNLDSPEDESRQELSSVSWWYQEIFQTHPFTFGVVSATVIGCIGIVLMQCTSQTRVRSNRSAPETGASSASRRMINELAAKKKIANIINQSTPDLCKFLTIDSAFLRELLAEEVITDEEKDIIKATPIRGHKVEIVLEIVKNSTATGGYDRFMELLKGNRTKDLYQMVKKIEKQSGL